MRLSAAYVTDTVEPLEITVIESNTYENVKNAPGK